VDGGFSLGMNLGAPGPVPFNQVIEVVAIGSISAEILLIKQAFDAAAQTNLIGVIVEAHRPAHLTVPAAAEDHYSSCSEPGGNHAKRP